MTSRERFINSIGGRPIDRFFRYEHGPWPSTRERWIAEGYPADADFQAFFEMDPIVRIAINSGYCDSPYYPGFEKKTIQETHDYVIYLDSDGVTKKVLKEHSDTSMPQFVKFPVAGREDWRRILERLNPLDAANRIGDPTPLVRSCLDPDIPTLLPICGAYGHPRNLLGEEGLAYTIYDAPKMLHEVLDNWCELYTELIRRLTAIVRVDAVLIWEDMCFKNGPLISPKHFQTLMLPRYGQFINTARDCGVECILVDSDGDVLEMIPLFLDAGVDCIMPFEVQAGMDVVKIRRESGRSFCIMGGLDKRALARDKKSIEEDVNRVIPFFVGDGRFIPTLDHTVPIDVPLANFQYYLECLRRFES